MQFWSINPKAAYRTIDNFLPWGWGIKTDGLKQKKILLMNSVCEILCTALFISYMECDTTKSMYFQTVNPEAAIPVLDLYLSWGWSIKKCKDELVFKMITSHCTRRNFMNDPLHTLQGMWHHKTYVGSKKVNRGCLPYSSLDLILGLKYWKSYDKQ